jgi:hypothetical protein
MRFAPAFTFAVALVSVPAGAADPPAAKAEPSAAPAATPATPPKPPPGAPGELPPIIFDPALNLRVDLHGKLSLLYYQPLAQLEDPRVGSKPLGPRDGGVEIYVASLEVSAKLGDFGVYINPRFRDTKSRDYFTSNVWLQQAYLTYELPHALLKLGKVENALSRLDDDTFYLSVLYFDGIKYANDYGLSVEGSFSWDSGFGLGYAAQYFPTDGRTNGALRDRDTPWVDGASRRDIGVLRVEPSYRFSATSSLRLGLAAQVSRVDLGAGYEPVVRVDADASFVFGPARVFAEGMAQIGQTVTAYPYAPTPATGGQPAVPGRVSTHNYYALAGAGFRIWRFYPRYAISFVSYADLPVNEMIHVPGVTFVAHDNVSILFEYGYWNRADPGRSYMIDNSITVLVNGKF